MKINIRVVDPTNQKLAMIKLVKDFSGLGLKEAKFFVDDIHNNLNKGFDIEILPTFSEDDVRKQLNNISGKFDINGGIQFQRHKKMLSLGIGSTDDLLEFTSEYISYQLYGKDISASTEFLISKFSKLSKEELKSLFKSLVDDSSL